MKRIIKNIFWDADGVLDNLNFAYFNFLKNHPKYKNEYADLKWEDLPTVLPIAEKYGALELKTHPLHGIEMDKDFCSSPDFFENRPLYPDVTETLKELHQKGYRQFTMSATFNVEVKKKFLNKLLSEVTDFLIIECVEHKAFMHDSAKEDQLRFCLDKYHLKKEETILVDDRIYNIDAALNVGIQPVRMLCEFTIPLKKEPKYQNVPEVHNMKEFKAWLFQNTVLSSERN